MKVQEQRVQAVLAYPEKRTWTVPRAFTLFLNRSLPRRRTQRRHGRARLGEPGDIPGRGVGGRQRPPGPCQADPASGFTRTAVGAWAGAHLAPGRVVVSDGLACFNGVRDAGCNYRPVVIRTPKPRDLPDFHWANTVLGNVKTSLAGASTPSTSPSTPRATSVPCHTDLTGGSSWTRLHNAFSPLRWPPARVRSTSCAEVRLLASNQRIGAFGVHFKVWIIFCLPSRYCPHPS